MHYNKSNPHINPFSCTFKVILKVILAIFCLSPAEWPLTSEDSSHTCVYVCWVPTDHHHQHVQLYIVHLKFPWRQAVKMR